MFRKIKRSQQRAIKLAEEVEYDSQGRAVINVGLQKASDLYSKYSYKSYELMNDDVDLHIRDVEQGIPTSDNIAINIFLENDCSENEKSKIIKTVERHYAVEYVNMKRNLKNSLILGISFSVLGLIILFFGALLNQMIGSYYLDSIIAVVGWFFLWDGIEIICTDLKDLKNTMLQCKRLMQSKVNILSYKEGNKF